MTKKLQPILFRLALGEPTSTVPMGWSRSRPTSMNFPEQNSAPKQRVEFVKVGIHWQPPIRKGTAPPPPPPKKKKKTKKKKKKKKRESAQELGFLELGGSGTL